MGTTVITPERSRQQRMLERANDVRSTRAVLRRSREQRMQALQRANEVRVRGARLKRDLKAGRAQLAGVIARPPECVQNLKVRDYLLAAPKIGPVKADKLLKQAGVAPGKKLGGMSRRQRQELLAVLGGYRR